MKFYLHKSGVNNFAPDCVSKTDGVFLKYNISQFFASGGGYNGFISTVKDDINKYPSAGISIQWGATSGNYIWNKYPFMETVESHHEGTGPPVHNKFPVVYNPGYIEEVRKFIEYLSIQLKPVMGKLAFIHTNGIEQTTFENRHWNQNFETTSDKNRAYEIAANQLIINADYTNDKLLNAFFMIYGYWELYFSHTLKISALISGKTGYPMVDWYGKFNLNPPKLTDSLLNHLSYFRNVSVMATALSHSGGVPNNFLSSEVRLCFQLDNYNMNQSLTAEQFESALKRAKDAGALFVEVYEINVREHNDIIEKYKSA